MVIKSANAAIGKPAVRRCGGDSAFASTFDSVVDIGLRNFFAVDHLAVGTICDASHHACRDVVGNESNRAVAKGEIDAGIMIAGEAADGERRCCIAAQFAMGQHAVLVGFKFGILAGFVATGGLPASPTAGGASGVVPGAGASLFASGGASGGGATPPTLPASGSTP